MTTLALIFAHPYPTRSRANRALLSAAEGLDGVDIHSLYDLYPDFDIDVETEQALLSRARVLVWQHPMYWYSAPGLLKHWFDRVLVRGFAYGEGGTALRDKRCLWVTTTGGEASAFSPTGMHGHPFEAFMPVMQQTARFCGMHWEEPLVIHGAHRTSEKQLAEVVSGYRARLQALLSQAGTAA
jgi:glutathione-regulated potassium-efflux system ancillary protein KefF